MKLFSRPITSLGKAGVLGMNARNLDFIAQHNQRSLYPLVDDKLKTKELAQEANVSVPELFGVVEFSGQWKYFQEVAQKHSSFVVKPSQGAGGGGILVINGVAKAGLRKMSGAVMPWAEVRYYLNNILSGMFSLGGVSDTAIIEERLVVHSAFKDLAFGGVPDVRIIVFRGVPIMGMLRLPTAESDGKANLHQGGIGAGVDIATGMTTRGVQHNETIEAHPDFETPVSGFKVPGWENILEIAAQLGTHVGLGYVGVDLVVDERKGPTLLELNARPGIAIQTANLRGLYPLLDRIEALEDIPEDPLKRVELAKANWRNEL